MLINFPLATGTQVKLDFINLGEIYYHISSGDGGFGATFDQLNNAMLDLTRMTYLFDSIAYNVTSSPLSTLTTFLQSYNISVYINYYNGIPSPPPAPSTLIVGPSGTYAQNVTTFDLATMISDINTVLSSNTVVFFTIQVIYQPLT